MYPDTQHFPFLASFLYISHWISSPILSPWVMGPTISPRHASSIREHCPSSLNMSLSSMELMSPLSSSQIHLKNRRWQLLDRWVHVFTRSYRHLLLAETRKWMEMVDVTTHYGKDLLKPLNLLPGACSYSHTHRDSQRLMIKYVWPRHVNLKIIHPSISNSFKCQQNTSQPSLVHTWPFAVLVELVKRPLDSCYLLPRERQQWEHHSETGSMTSPLDS